MVHWKYAQICLKLVVVSYMITPEQVLDSFKSVKSSAVSSVFQSHLLHMSNLQRSAEIQPKLFFLASKSNSAKFVIL